MDNDDDDNDDGTGTQTLVRTCNLAAGVKKVDSPSSDHHAPPPLDPFPFHPSEPSHLKSKIWMDPSPGQVSGLGDKRPPIKISDSRPWPWVVLARPPFDPLSHAETY